MYASAQKAKTTTKKKRNSVQMPHKKRVVAIVGEGLPEGYLEDESCSSSSSDELWDNSSSFSSSEEGAEPVVLVSKAKKSAHRYVDNSSDTSSASSNDAEPGKAHVNGRWVDVSVRKPLKTQAPVAIEPKVSRSKPKKPKATAVASAPELSRVQAEKSKAVRYGGETWTRERLSRRVQSLRRQMDLHMQQYQTTREEYKALKKVLNTM